MVVLHRFRRLSHNSDPAASAGGAAEDLIAKLNENYQTFSMIEQRLMQRRASSSGKLPEVQKTLDALLMLQERHAAEDEVGHPPNRSNGLPLVTVEAIRIYLP